MFCDILSPKAFYGSVVLPLQTQDGMQFCHIRYIRPGGVTPVDVQQFKVCYPRTQKFFTVPLDPQ